MKRSYNIKNRILPLVLPVAVPAIGVPLSLATAWSIHAWQSVRLNMRHYRNKKATPCAIPRGSGGANRSQDEAISKMPLAAFDPLPLNGYASTGLRTLPDIAPMYFDSGTVLRGRLHRYPRHFHETLIPVSGGIPISGIMGLHHSKLPRPGLIIVHGLMNSKRQDLVRVVTLRAFYEWGFNVISIDTRGFGRSAESVSVPTAAGWLEAGDLIEVARYLKKFPHFLSVGLLGFSLGAGAVLNAAALKEAETLFDGGVMAISAPINFEACVRRFEDQPADEEHLLTYHFFKYLLARMLKHSELMRWVRKKVEAEGGDPNVSSFTDFLGLIAWGNLGRGRRRTRDPEKLRSLLLRFTSPSRSLGHVRVPTFVLHAKDDPMTRIDADDIALLERVSRANPLLRYPITETGGHAAFVLLDPSWFYKIVRSYFTYWGRWTKDKIGPFGFSNLVAEPVRSDPLAAPIAAAAATAAALESVG